MNSALQKVYFHVGISKTGSTFLQKRVFPFLSKIDYVPTNRYQNIFFEIIFVHIDDSHFPGLFGSVTIDSVERVKERSSVKTLSVKFQYVSLPLFLSLQQNFF